ncbi:MAG: hypothetical protein KatS3mg125_0488 [Lysobacterales bacterium]|jgi:hypothetical protein|nr:MAG: hypothetical protein KatS3mg125_0488 [Xanthomonadales bacterium]
MLLAIEALIVFCIATPVLLPETRGFMPTWAWLGAIAFLLLLRRRFARLEASRLQRGAPNPQNRVLEGRCSLGRRRRARKTAFGF